MNFDIYTSLVNSEKYNKLANTTYLVTDNIKPRTQLLILPTAAEREESLRQIELEQNQNVVLKKLQTLMRQLLSDLEQIYNILNGSNRVTSEEHEYLERIRAQIFLVLHISDIVTSKFALSENISATMDALVNGVLGSMDVDRAMERYAVDYNEMMGGGEGSYGNINGLDSREFDPIRFPVSLPADFEWNPSILTIYNIIMSSLLSQTGPRLLLSGQPGIGKTLAAHFAATHFCDKKNLFIISQGNLLETYVGEAEKRLTNLFNYFRKNPSVKGVLFMDEGDEYLSANVNQNLSGCKNVIQTNLGDTNSFTNLCIILATNYLNKIDEPIANRFTTKIEYPNPTIEVVSKVVWNFLKIGSKTTEAIGSQNDLMLQLIEEYQSFWQEILSLQIDAKKISYRSANGIVTTFAQNLMFYITNNETLNDGKKILFMFLNPTNSKEILVSTYLPEKITLEKYKENAVAIPEPFRLDNFQLYYWSYDSGQLNDISIWNGYKVTIIAANIDK